MTKEMLKDCDWQKQLETLNEQFSAVQTSLVDLNKNLVTQDHYEKLQQHLTAVEIARDNANLEKEKEQKNNIVIGGILSKVCCLLGIGDRTNDLEDELTNVLKQKEYFENNFNEKSRDYEDLKKNYEEKEENLTQKEKDYGELDKEKRAIKEQKDKLETKLKLLRGYLKLYFGIQQSEKIEEYDDILKKYAKDSTSFSNEVNEWQEVSNEYMSLLDIWRNCNVLHDFREKKLGSGSEKQQLMKLVEQLGRGDGFLEDIYTEFKKCKKSVPEGLSGEEIKFFEEINAFCKKHFKITFDVFKAPDTGKLQWEKAKFEKKEMEDIKNPKSPNRYADKLCVPKLMCMETEEMAHQALVVTDNMNP